MIIVFVQIYKKTIIKTENRTWSNPLVAENYSFLFFLFFVRKPNIFRDDNGTRDKGGYASPAPIPTSFFIPHTCPHTRLFNTSAVVGNLHWGYYMYILLIYPLRIKKKKKKKIKTNSIKIFIKFSNIIINVIYNETEILKINPNFKNL